MDYAIAMILAGLCLVIVGSATLNLYQHRLIMRKTSMNKRLLVVNRELMNGWNQVERELQVECRRADNLAVQLDNVQVILAASPRGLGTYGEA